MRQHHDQWELTNGLYLPHSYDPPRDLSWWDDIGFILNGRRIMVWWIHPRMSYADAIEERAWETAVIAPAEFSTLLGHESSQKIWKKVGKSRKKIVGYQTLPQSEARREHYDKLFAAEKRLKAEGIDFEVRPSITVKAYSWGRGVELCVPVEVRNEQEARGLANLVRRVIKREASLEFEFPDYRYGRNEWLAESGQRGAVD